MEAPIRCDCPTYLALLPLSVKQRWIDVEQSAFDQMKAAISIDVLLLYPDFTQPFEIQTDASNAQLGWGISQMGRPVAFYC